MNLSGKNAVAIGLIILAKVLTIMAGILGFVAPFRSYALGMFVLAGVCLISSVFIAVVQLKELERKESQKKKDELATRLVSQFNLNPELAKEIVLVSHKV